MEASQPYYALCPRHAYHQPQTSLKAVASNHLRKTDQRDFSVMYQVLQI